MGYHDRRDHGECWQVGVGEMNERIWAIYQTEIYNPSVYKPVGFDYAIRLWINASRNRVNEEPLTRDEAEVFLKLLTDKGAT